MKVRFSESFIASHRINQRERMQKSSIHVVARDTRWISHLCNSFLSLSESTWGGTDRPSNTQTIKTITVGTDRHGKPKPQQSYSPPLVNSVTRTQTRPSGSGQINRRQDTNTQCEQRLVLLPPSSAAIRPWRARRRLHSARCRRRPGYLWRPCKLRIDFASLSQNFDSTLISIIQQEE